MFVWIGVGIGEVGCLLLFYFLILDYFLFEKCFLVFGIFVFGILIGLMLVVLGGVYIVICGGFDWCDVFIWMGLFGVFGVILFKLMVKELL